MTAKCADGQSIHLDRRGQSHAPVHTGVRVSALLRTTAASAMALAMLTGHAYELPFGLGSHAVDQQLLGRVVGIADGDTVTILDADSVQHRIRLMGIDAPEKAQPFGQRSKQNLFDLVGGRDVVAQCGKFDRYGRRICKVLVDGTDANLAQVVAGMAWHYKAYVREQRSNDRTAYAGAELEAQRTRRGLWSDPLPVSPWDWRREKTAAR
jgi:endonuclease YncB( thermonuclease family)